MAHNEWLVEALELMRDTCDSKNDDYADSSNPFSNFEGTARITGLSVDQVFFTMIGIKVERLRQLMGGKTPKHESIKDSVLDLADYAALWLSYMLRGRTDGVSQSWVDGLGKGPVYEDKTVAEAWVEGLRDAEKNEAEKYIEDRWPGGVRLGPGGTKNSEEG